MILKQDVIKVVQKTFAKYYDDFIYLDLVEIHMSGNVISGKIRYTGAKYMKVYNKIMHNIEAMYIFNQAMYILVAAYFLEHGKITPDNPDEAYRKIDGVVFKDMEFSFKRSITEHDDLVFECRAETFEDQKGRLCFVIDLDLAEGAFKVSGTIVCLEKSVHLEGI